jgi:hypothetical protein
MHNKLKNFPVVNYPNLRTSSNRQEFMKNQLDHYGLKGNQYLTDRYDEIKDQIHIDCQISMDQCHPGTNTSYLNLLKQWYDQADEQIGLFCDDDISFETIDHWNFTWQDFLDHLPEDWQCVQLIRINLWESNLSYHGREEIPNLKIRNRMWDDYGSSFLCKRSYVKKLLDRHLRGENSYDFSIPCAGDAGGFLFPIAEHLLFREICNNQIFNVPILLENQTFDSDIHPNMLAGQRLEHVKSYEYYSGLWKTYGKDLSIQQLMKL